MEIGTEVVVNKTAHPTYLGNKRTWYSYELPKPKLGYYVGYTFKQEGTYKDGRTFNPIIEEYEQPYLTDIKTIKLIRIKFSPRGNDQFAFPKDIYSL